MQIKAKQVLKYTLLPGILPMVRDLFSSGFGYVAFYMATIYAGARLLPANHAYVNTQNIGRFGISSVILEAARNLNWNRKNLDQIFIFLLVLTGFILLIAQFALMGFALFMQSSYAGGGYAQFLVTPDTTNDIAHILMDRVFGIPGMFDSCVSTGQICLNGTIPEGAFPLPYHGALQDMLAFYSVGLCAIGLIIFLYYIVAIVVETAQTGTPFGRRFNHVWAPIRMVVALALLIPISYGMNGAQLLTLNIAKWGSAFATNGWNTFVHTLVDASISPLGTSAADLVADPEKPNPNNLLQFYTVLGACKKAYMLRDQIEIGAYLVRDGVGAINTNRMDLAGSTWDQARQFHNNGDIVVVFGEMNETKYRSQKGGVKPWCGEIVLPQVDLVQEGSVSIQTSYYAEFILAYWNNINTGAPTIGAASTLPAPNNRQQDYFFNAADRIIETALVAQNSDDAMMPNEAAKNTLLNEFNNRLDVAIQAAVTAQINSSNWLDDLEDYGWAGAGIWYNRIAELNGGLIAGIANVPQVRAWPLVMEKVAEEKGRKDKAMAAENRFVPYLSDGAAVELPADLNFEYAGLFSSAYALWNDGNSVGLMADGTPSNFTTTSNPLTDFIQYGFGTQGLFNMRENAEIHPLAQIVTMGKYLLEASIRNLGLGALGPLGEKMLSFVGLPPAFAQAIAIMARTVGMMTLIIGFVLYYVVPFLPFMYFFFQVGGWIKGLFEAMVGLPLWALAHIRIDGDGLPGTAAMNGYFLLLDIFLRPILTIFGMIGGIAIFAAQVQVLNDIFEIVVSNLTGFNAPAASLGVFPSTPVAGTSAVTPDPATLAGTFDTARDYIDQFFYTVIYAIIVYMMGTASFKLVYLVPDNIMRWMGSSVDGFGEIAKTPPEALVGTMYTSSQVATNQLGGAMRNLISRG